MCGLEPGGVGGGQRGPKRQTSSHKMCFFINHTEPLYDPQNMFYTWSGVLSHFHLTFKSDTGQHSQFVLCPTYKLPLGIFSPIFLFHLLTRKSPFGQHFFFPPDKFCHQLHLALQEYYTTVTLFATNDTICPMILSALQEYYRTVALFSKDDFPQKMLKGRLPSKNSQSMISLKKCSKDDFPQKILKG